MRKPRHSWIFPAIIAFITFLGGTAGNLIAEDLKRWLEQYRVLVWTVFFVALVVAVAAAIRDAAAKRAADRDTSLSPEDLIVRPPGAAAPTTLHQLPPPPREFTDREQIVTEVVSDVEAGETAYAIYGTPGVGKSALALVLAERFKPRFPDAQIYLRAYDEQRQQPLVTSEVMAHVVHSFWPSLEVQDEAKLAASYYSLVNDKRVLLLLDNLSGEEQIAPLVPPDNCLLLVTSRQRFNLPGLKAKQLNILSPADARELLLKIAPRIGNQADALAELCGYLPFALRLAASALVKQIDIRPRDYVRRLRSAQRRLELIDASLELSYKLLDREKQRLWCALSVFSGTFDVAGAAAVWDLPPERAHYRLSSLVSYSLVEWNESSGRYFLLDLVGLFAAANLSEDERAIGQRRHAKYYLSVARHANDLYQRGSDDLIRGLEIFDADRANIQAGQTWAAAQADEDDEAAQLCSDYPDAVKNILPLRQHPNDQIAWREAALAAARLLGKRGAEAKHLGNIGRAYLSLGQTDRAIGYFEQDLAITDEIGDRQGGGHALGNLGWAYYIKGEIQSSKQYFERQLAVAREIKDRRMEADAFGRLGIIQDRLGYAKQAIELTEQELAINRSLGRSSGVSGAMSRLAVAYRNAGEPGKSIELLEEAIVIARGLGDRNNEHVALSNLAVAYDDLGDTRQAVNVLEETLVITRELGDRRVEGVNLGNLGEGYADLGELERALKLYEEALRISGAVGDRANVAYVLFNKGRAYASMGDTRQAIETYEKALETSISAGFPRLEIDIRGNLAQLYWGAGDGARALEHYGRQRDVAEEIGERQKVGSALFNMSLVIDRGGDRARAVERAAEALKVFEEIGNGGAADVRAQLDKWRDSGPAGAPAPETPGG